MSLTCSSSVQTIPHFPSTHRIQFQKNALVGSSNNVSKLQKIKKAEPFSHLPAAELKTFKLHYFEDEKTEKKYDSSIKVPINFNVLDFIKHSITIINKQLEERNQLKFDEDAYNLYFAKKNGEPKSDLPALDYNQVLFETGAVTLCLKKKVNKIKSSRCSIDSNNSTTVVSNYRNSNSLLICKKEIVPQLQRNAPEHRGFWSFFLCIC